MLCTKCGILLEDNAKFCTTCGEVVSSQDISESNEIVYTEPSFSQTQYNKISCENAQPQNPSSNPITTIALVVLSILVIFLYSSNTKLKNAKSDIEDYGEQIVASYEEEIASYKEQIASYEEQLASYEEELGYYGYVVDEYENRNAVDKTIDAIGSWFDIFD